MPFEYKVCPAILSACNAPIATACNGSLKTAIQIYGCKAGTYGSITFSVKS